MSLPRTILKQDLVRKLYPNSVSVNAAMQQLRREIDLSLTLKENLAKAGHLKRHFYTKQQVILILEHLCISIDEFEEL